MEPPALVPRLALELQTAPQSIKEGKKRREKMKKSFKVRFILFLLVTGSVLLSGFVLKAEEAPVTIPHRINFQSILTDPAGNPLPDGKYNVSFRLLDLQGVSLYEEWQNLESNGGIVSAMIGSQNELELSLLSPASIHFLETAVEGSGPPIRMEIVSVPYAYYAEEALKVAPLGVGTKAIQPKSITADLLADDVLKNLGMEGNFIYSRGVSVQGAIKDLDTAIHQRQVNLDRTQNDLNQTKNDLNQTKTDLNQAKISLEKGISDETTARIGADISLQQSIASVDNRVTSMDNKVSTVNTSISADYNNLNTTVGDLSSDVDALQALPKIVAWGVIESGALSGRYNISMTNSAEYTLSFSNPVELPYAVTVTPLDSNANYAVYERTRSGFKVRNSIQSLGPISFIVVK